MAGPSAQSVAPGPARRRAAPGALLSVLCTVLGAVLCALPGLAYLAGRLSDRWVADADLLLLHELLPDLAHGGTLATWHVPLANFLLPDWPLYALALALGPTPAATIALFAALELGLLAGAVHLVTREIDRRAAPVLTLAVLALVVGAVLAQAVPLVYLAASFVHAGTVTASVASLGLALRWIRRPDRTTLALSAAVAFAATLSDQLFAVWSLIPIGAALVALALAHRQRVRSTVGWLAVHAVAALAALPLPRLLFPVQATEGLSFGFHPRSGLGRLVRSLLEVHETGPALIPLVTLATLAVAALLVRGRSLRGAPLATDTRLVLAVHAVTLAVGLAVAQIALAGVAPPNARYDTLAFLLPLILLPTLAGAGPDATAGPAGDGVAGPGPGAGRERRSGRLLAVAGIGLPLALIAGYTATWITRVDLHRTPVPVACVEQALAATGSRHGIASYWEARPFQVFSDGRLLMAETGFDLRPYPVNANDVDYVASYDFAVVSPLWGQFNLNETMIRHLAGEPRTTTACGPWTVLDYGPGGLTLESLGQSGASRTFTGCQLYFQVGRRGPDCRLTVGPADGPGLAVYGPYALVPAGTYRLTVGYASTGPTGAAVGDWEVTLDNDGEVRAAAGSLPGTAGQPATAVAELTVDGPDLAIIQWRLETTPGAEVRIDDLTITRLS